MLILKSLKDLRPSWFYDFFCTKGDINEDIRDLLWDVFENYGHLWPWFDDFFTSQEWDFSQIHFEGISRKGDSFYVSLDWWYQTTDSDGDIEVNHQDYWDLCLPKILNKIINDTAEYYISNGWMLKETWDSIPEYEGDDDE